MPVLFWDDVNTGFPALPFRSLDITTNEITLMEK
jgi:hypothetical protein